MRKSSLGVAALATVALSLVAGCGSTVNLGAGQGSLSSGASAEGSLNDLSGLGTGDTGASPTSAPSTTDTSGTDGQQVVPTDEPTDVAVTPTTGSGGASTGGPRPTTPLELGFVTTAVSNAASLGVSAGSTISDRAVDEAVVKYYNAHGGINGRKINPIYSYTDTGGNDWSSEFQAACANFTQDHHVSAVLGYVFIYLDAFEKCLANAKAVHVSASYQPGDVVAQREMTTLVSSAHPPVDVADIVPLEGALRAGMIGGSAQLGILLDHCAHGDRAWKNTEKPWLDSHKIRFNLVEGECGNGAGDSGSAVATLQSAVLKFSAAGVKTVYATGPALLLFMVAANAQNYHPDYITSMQGAGLEPNSSKQQLAKVHGFGWSPEVDVNPSHQPYGYNAAQSQCLKMLNDSGLKPREYNDFFAAYTICDSIGLYAAALKLTDGTPTPAELVAALVKAIPTFAAASPYGGRFAVSPNARGGPSVYRAWNWSTKCDCFQYSGPTYPIPRV